MTLTLTLGWWMLPLAVMWAYVAYMFALSRLDWFIVLLFGVSGIVVTAIALLTRFLP